MDGQVRCSGEGVYRPGGEFGRQHEKSAERRRVEEGPSESRYRTVEIKLILMSLPKVLPRRYEQLTAHQEKLAQASNEFKPSCITPSDIAPM